MLNATRASRQRSRLTPASTTASDHTEARPRSSTAARVNNPVAPRVTSRCEGARNAVCTPRLSSTRSVGTATASTRWARDSPPTRAGERQGLVAATQVARAAGTTSPRASQPSAISEQPPGGPGHGPVAHCPVDAEAGRGEVPGRVQQVALVAAQVLGRALLVVPVGRLPRGVRRGRAGVVPLRGAQEHRPVRRQQPKGVDLVVERPEEIGARLGSAPGGLVGRRDQGAHAPGGVDGGLAVGDRLREPVVDHGVDHVEDRGVAGEDVPLEDPHHAAAARGRGPVTLCSANGRMYSPR